MKALLASIILLASACVADDDIELGEAVGEVMTTLPGSGVSSGFSSSSTPTVFRGANWKLQVIGGLPSGGIGWDMELDPGYWRATPNPIMVGGFALASTQYTAIQQPDGKTVVLAAANGYLYRSQQLAAYSNVWTWWTAIATAASVQPAMARNLDGRIEAVYVGTDGRVKQLWQSSVNGAWSAPYDTGVVSSNPPEIARDPWNRLEIFVPISTGACGITSWRQREVNGFEGWFPPVLKSGPCNTNLAVIHTGNATDVLTRAPVVGVSRYSRTSPDYTFQTPAPMPFPGIPTIVRKDDGRILALGGYTACYPERPDYPCGLHYYAERTTVGWRPFEPLVFAQVMALPLVGADAWVNKTTVFVNDESGTKLDRYIFQ